MTTNRPLSLLFSVILGVFFLAGCDNNKNINPLSPNVRADDPVSSTSTQTEGVSPVLTSGNPGPGKTQSVCAGVKGAIFKTGEELLPNLLRVRVRVASEGDDVTLNVYYGSRKFEFTNGKEDTFDYDRPNTGAGSRHESLDLEVVKGGQKCWKDKVDFQVPEKEGPVVTPNPENPDPGPNTNPGPEGPRDPLCRETRSGVHCTVLSKNGNQRVVMFTNASSQMQQVNIHPYKVFGVTNGFPDMESQVRYVEGSASANLAPSSSVTLTATLPGWCYQLDAYLGPTIEKAPHDSRTLLGFEINLTGDCKPPTKCDPSGLQIQDTNGETTSTGRKGVLHVIFADALTGKVKIGNSAPIDVRPNQGIPYDLTGPEPGQPDAWVEAELTTYENGVLCGRHVIKIRVPAKPKPEEPKEVCPDLKTDVTLVFGEVPDPSLRDIRKRVLYSANWVGGQMDGVFKIIGFGERGYRKGNPPNAWDFDWTDANNDYDVEFEFIPKTKEGLSCPVRKKIRIPARPKKECKLVITKTSDQFKVWVGERVTFKLEFQNKGNGSCTGSGVLIEDDLHPSMEFKNGSRSSNIENGPDLSGRTVKWSTHELTPGESGWVVFTVKMQQSGTFKNVGRITAQELKGQWMYSNPVMVEVREPDPPKP